MNKNTRKIISTLVVVTFLLSTFFVCLLMSQLSSMGHDLQHSSNFSCCDDGVFALMHHNVPSILNQGTNLQFLLIILVAAYLLFRNKSLIRDEVFRNYFARRSRYRNFKLLDYLTVLFSQGILHPKIY